MLYLFCLAIAPALMADTTTLTFETLAEGDVVNSQFSGVTFGGGPVVLTAGSLLNDIDFPAHSGVNVLVDLGGPILINFAPAAISFSGYFTFTTQLTFEIFRAGDVTPSSTLWSSPGPNLGASEWIGFSSTAADISALQITGDPSGGSFTLDDLSFTSPAPEPSSLLLLIPMAALVFRYLPKNGER